MKVTATALFLAGLLAQPVAAQPRVPAQKPASAKTEPKPPTQSVELRVGVRSGIEHPHNAWNGPRPVPKTSLMQGRLTGFHPKTAIVVEAQEPSAPVAPTKPGALSMLRGALRKALKFSSPDNRAYWGKTYTDVKDSGKYDTQLQVGTVWKRGWAEGLHGETRGDYHYTELFEGNALPVHTPVRVRSFDHPTQYTNVKGVKSQEWSEVNRWINPNGGNSVGGWSQNSFELKMSGRDHVHYKPWLQTKNLASSAPRFAAGKTRGTAVLLGLAAFPIGSTVRVTNIAMQKNGEAGHTVEKRVTRTGSVRIPYPVTKDGSLYRLTVEFPGVKDASETTRASYIFTGSTGASKGGYQPIAEITEVELPAGAAP